MRIPPEEVGLSAARLRLPPLNVKPDMSPVQTAHVVSNNGGGIIPTIKIGDPAVA
jgi:hypothetical protein